MAGLELSHDAKWPRANNLFSESVQASDIALIGIPAFLTSLSPTSAHLTPAAIRGALARYSSFSATGNVDLRSLSISDLGDVESPDGEDGEARVAEAVANVRSDHELLIALGGDNSITYSVARGLWRDLSNVGVVTFDAHHDLRDGKSNGSPIWRLFEAGLPGKNIVQVGISDFANSAEYSQRAADMGITVIHRSEIRGMSIDDATRKALAIAGAGGREIYVDIDVDVCDRSVAPACPASVPGGISADELRQIAHLVGTDRRVCAIDITEIDALLDTADQRTIRLAALLILEAVAGFARR
jgi:formiminoglutamase